MVKPSLVVLYLLKLLPTYRQIASNDLFCKNEQFWTNRNNSAWNNSGAENRKEEKEF